MVYLRIMVMIDYIVDLLTKPQMEMSTIDGLAMTLLFALTVLAVLVAKVVIEGWMKDRE